MFYFSTWKKVEIIYLWCWKICFIGNESNKFAAVCLFSFCLLHNLKIFHFFLFFFFALNVNAPFFPPKHPKETEKNNFFFSKRERAGREKNYAISSALPFSYFFFCGRSIFSHSLSVVNKNHLKAKRENLHRENSIK